MIKDIIIAHNFSETSFSIMSYKLAFFLANKGCNVIFISHQPYFESSETIEVGDGSIIVMSWTTKSRPTSFNDFIHFIKIFLKYKPQVVLGHFTGSNISCIMSKILSLGRTRTLAYYHTLSTQNKKDNNKSEVLLTILNFRKQIFYKLFCDDIICPSSLAKKDLANCFKSNKGKVVLNPMKDRFNLEEKTTGDIIIISYLGRLSPSKGVSDLLQAFLSYIDVFPNTRLRLQIAGGSLNEYNDMSVISDFITYKGNIAYEEVDAYILKSNFMIIPSKFDNLPTVGLESLMNATPLLISEHTGLSAYLKEDYDCFQFKPTVPNIKTIFENVECLSELKYKSMCANARATFLEKFDIVKYCNNMLKIIK